MSTTMKPRDWIQSIIHCIASLAALVLMSATPAQGSRPISLRDARRWQDLHGHAEAALAKGRWFSHAHPIFWAPSFVVRD